MASSTAITWVFNFIISLTWPKLVESFGSTGAFCWYVSWNLFGWDFAYFLLPETKNLTLEELDNVFGVRDRDHGGYYLKKLPWYVNKYGLRRDVEPFPPLYHFADEGRFDMPDKPTAYHNDGPMTGARLESETEGVRRRL
ncbi:Fc.00g096260.m01.CDS01 [Cosmosporella sp. VM-42]